MGLGKTVQMIGLIATHSDPKNALAPTLVVIPPVLISTWIGELKLWAPRLKVYPHYGSYRERTKITPFIGMDVVITTYNTLVNDLELIKKVKWWRIVLDEAHKIKNPKTKIATACYSVRARNRWAMTGTPIQNHWRDFFSLLKFLRVRP